MFPWKYRSINSTKIPITYPAGSITKIGATLTRLTSIADGCFSGFFEAKNDFMILFLIPLSRICANLWRNFYNIKGLIRCHFERILTKTLHDFPHRILTNVLSLDTKFFKFNIKLFQKARNFLPFSLNLFCSQ